MESILLKPEEVAECLNIGRSKVYELMRSGRLESIRIDACRRVSRTVWPAADGRPANDKQDREEWYGLQGTAGSGEPDLWNKPKLDCDATVGHPAGRHYFPHEARHTTATQLLEEGVDETTITRILGHSSIITSRGYMHASTASALEALGDVAGRYALG